MAETTIRRCRLCVTIDLVGGLRLSDDELQGIVSNNGHSLSPQEVRAVFVAFLRQGYDVMPVCDHHDAAGHCLGHEVEE